MLAFALASNLCSEVTNMLYLSSRELCFGCRGNYYHLSLGRDLRIHQMGLDFILFFLKFSPFLGLLPGFVYLFTELNQNPKPSIYRFRSFRWFWYAEFSSKPAIFCVVPFFYSRICCVNTDYIFIIVPDGADI